MKKFLPTSQRFSVNKGFTLIELLTVVAIIAIISVIAIALFGNAQKQARDGKRIAELEQIANVLEINKTTAGYQPITASLFAGGNFPGGAQTQALDPSGYGYCIAADSTTTTPAAWTAAACPTGWSTIVGTTPAAGSTSYKLCTSKEIGGVLCRTSQQ